MIKIKDLTATALSDGGFRDVLPEYYDISKVTENGSWHDHQNVFDHVIKVLQSYEDLLGFSFLSTQQRQKIEKYLSEKVTDHTYKEILTLTILLHDIAKTDTLIAHADGTANCPGHELIGAGMMKDFKARFDLSETEYIRLEKLVRFHGFVSVIVDRIHETGNTVHNYTLYEETVGDIALDLIIFIYADLHGCDLETSKPELFHAYEEIQISYIKNLVDRL